MLNKKALAATAATQALYVEDVFSTYLYTGTGSALTITNGIDLSGEGGMVWIKRRDTTGNNPVFDTERGAGVRIYTNQTVANDTNTGSLSDFNSDGFSLGTNSGVNASSGLFASWTFRKAEKFFDVVTYTGTGSARTISHNLGSVPGCIIVKRTDTTGDWQVYHRGIDVSENKYLVLNSTGASAQSAARWNNTLPTSTVFSLGTDATVNANGGTYVAYLFAHDAGGFGISGSENVISCGSYVGNGTTTNLVTLGYEPQWILAKASSGAGNWYIWDTMRGWDIAQTSSGDTDKGLIANTTGIEADLDGGNPTATGFNAQTNVNDNGVTYIYIAVRRGQMSIPEAGTEVFTPTVYTGTNVDNRLVDTTIAPDFVMIRQRNDTVIPGMYTGARLTGQEFLITGSTSAGATDADSFDAQIVSTVEYGNAFSSMSGVWVGNDATRKFNANTTSNNHVIYAFKRAAGFFDVVCYTGTGANADISHNLDVIPEMVVVKKRDATASGEFQVYSAPTGNGNRLQFANNSASSSSSIWNNKTPTSTVFSVGSNTAVNSTGNTYIALLFASCPGVSKVGSYTGNGTSQTINCGFTSGARFILIKRTDSTGDWYVYDSARGIVTGNDPQLKLNSQAAEATGFDAIDPDNSGFIVNNDATNFPINVNSATYIYLAIA